VQKFSRKLEKCNFRRTKEEHLLIIWLKYRMLISKACSQFLCQWVLLDILNGNGFGSICLLYKIYE